MQNHKTIDTVERERERERESYTLVNSVAVFCCALKYICKIKDSFKTYTKYSCAGFRAIFCCV